MGVTLDNGALPDVDTATEDDPTGKVQVVGLSATSLAALETIQVGNFPATQPVSGTVAVSNFPTTTDITDRAARLVGHVTVDNFPATQPVSGTFWQATQPVSGTVGVNNFPATQPVSLATNTPDVTDRAARLLGHVTVDTAPTTAVTGPLTDAQLRASAVPVSMATQTPDVTDRAARLLGHVTVDAAPTTAVTGTFWQATQPVSLATNAPDVTDRAAREVGRVRVWDGVDEATVLARGTVPAATDKGLCVVTLNQPRPSYQVVTAELTSGTAIAVARPLAIWHPATLTKDVYILEIGANVGVQHTAGRFAFELSFISAESATGTVLTSQPLDRSQAASGLSLRALPTAETLVGAIFQRAAQGPAAAATPQGTNYDGVVIYRAKDLDDYSDAIRLQSGVAEGLLVRQNIIATLTTAPIYSVYARWVERA